MNRKLIADIRPNEIVDQSFLVKFKQLRTAKNGSLFIHMELVDRSGVLVGRMWKASEAIYQTFSDGDLVQVRGEMQIYQNQLQVVVKAIQRISAEGLDIADFLPHTEKDVEALWQRLVEILSTISQPHLLKLVSAFLEDPEFARKFRRSPAAVDYHHAYVGGLLEHTVSLLELGQLTAEHYPELSRDILLAGLFFHDIGKVDELSYDRLFAYTDRGGLVGHIVLGATMVREKASSIPELAGGLLDVLEHIILSHHGFYEFGSPKLPMTPEAIAVHHLDNLDAKINAMHRIITTHGDPTTNWTDWAKMFERRLFKRSRALAEVPEPREENE